MTTRTEEEVRKLARTVTIPPQLEAILDRDHDYEPPPEGDDPVEHEASELSALFIAESDVFEDFARGIDGDPVNGVDAENIRTLALYMLRAVNRYVAAREARYGAAEDVFVEVPEEAPADDAEGEDDDAEDCDA